MSKDSALIRYYARIVKKGYYTIDEVPEEYRKDVKVCIKTLPPLKRTADEANVK